MYIDVAVTNGNHEFECASYTAAVRAMIIGYARVSTKRQKLDLQVKALELAKCDLVLLERLSGGGGIGRGLLAALGSCRSGDTLVVWKLDRLGRNLRELLSVLEVLVQREIKLRVLTGAASAIDLGHGEGIALYTAYAAFAAMERDMNRERTLAGLSAKSHVEKQRRRVIGSNERSARFISRSKTTKKTLRCAFNRKSLECMGQ